MGGWSLRFSSLPLRRLAGLLLVVAGVAALIGCSTPRERYVILSTFFDGVPDPDKVVAAAEKEEAKEEGPKVVTSSIVSRHKPYVENQCASCHRVGGMIAEFDVAYKQCGKCHAKVTTAYPKMHGPVALSACEWCHAPHESSQKFLLKDTSVKVCGQCHDQNLLSATPVQHTDGTDCLSCHGGHGGTERHFLKDGWRPVWPEAGAGTQPSTRPASTRPAERLQLQAGGGEA